MAVATVEAQTTFTWTGLTGDQLFNTPGNWQGGVVPTGNPTDNIVFGVFPQQLLTITTSLNVGNITFSGNQDGFYLIYNTGTPTLTLNGNVTTTAGARYWGLFELPVILSAGNHIYNVGASADIYHFDSISGAGSITKNGPNSLILSDTNSYTGGTVLNSGWLYVGRDNSLGTGTVTLNGGILATSYTDIEAGAVVLENNFVFGANVSFGSFVGDSQPLTLGNNTSATTIAPVTGVTTVNLNQVGKDALTLDGRMIDGAAATTYAFAGETPYFLSGNNSYTGGTIARNGATVIFERAASVPANGLITAEANAYVGLQDNGMTATSFVGHMDPVNSAGIIGFDGGLTFTGDIDLTNFTHIGVALGTSSSATLTGNVTPPAGAGGFQFSGSGMLFLQDGVVSAPLTGNNNLQVYSTVGKGPMVVVLARTAPNTYTGGTLVANGGGLVLDNAGALPAASTVQVAADGYVSVTDTSGLTLADLVARVDPSSFNGAIGVDLHSSLYGLGGTYVYSAPVDLSSITQTIYLGTISSTEITGPITTFAGNAGDYFFTGFDGGYLKISTQLTGNRQVHVGLPGEFQVENHIPSAVELANVANNFTGGIVINSGQLTTADPRALGTGDITVDTTFSDGRVFLHTESALANNLNLVTGTLDIYSGSPLNVSGVISGGGRLSTGFGSNLTISGNNTYSGGSLFSATPVTVTSNSGLGTGPLELDLGGSVVFTSAAPQIGSLLRGDLDDSAGIVYAALNLAAPGTTTLTINQTLDGIFGGAIIQSGGSVGSLVKTGPATLTILGDVNAGATVYSGGTTILNGQLVAGAPGALGPGTITINGGTLGTAPGVALANPITFGASGGTLSGTGTFNVPITVGANVKLAPGNSPGALSFSAGLTFASSGQLNFEVQSAAGPAGTGYDLVSVSGAVLDITATTGSRFTLKVISLNAGGTAGNVSDFSAGTGYSWLVATSVAGINGFAANKFTIDTSSFSNSLGSGSFSLVQGVSGGNPALFLNFNPVPEPSTYALLALGLGSIAIATLRRRRG